MASMAEIAAQYNLPPCINMFIAGQEYPCCTFWHAIAAQGSKALKPPQDGLATTACRPGYFGPDCREGQEVYVEQHPPKRSL